MTANGIRRRERKNNYIRKRRSNGACSVRPVASSLFPPHPSTPSKQKDWLPYSEVSPFRMFKKEGKPILSLYFIANALLRSNASRPTFDCVSSHVRSCLVPRSLKSIGTAAPTHYFRVFKIEYWQPRPRCRDLIWPA